MRTILPALLCSSLLTGGAAPAAAAVIQPHTASFTVTKLTFGQSDYNAFLEHLSEIGCPTSMAMTHGGETYAKTSAACLNISGEEFHVRAYRPEFGPAVVRSVIVTFNSGVDTFHSLAGDYRKSFGEPDSSLRLLDGSLEAVWKRYGVQLRIVQRPTNIFGFIEYSSVTLEEKIRNESRATANAGAAGG